MNDVTPESDRIASVYRNRPDLGLYSVFRQSHLYMLQEVERALIELLRRRGQTSLEGCQILDIGCGNGFWIRRMMDWGGEPQCMSGIDILPEHILAAERRLPTRCDVRVGDATRLPWPSGSFDVVSQYVMFSSVLDHDLRRGIAAEMTRVLRPGGCVLWYDFTVDNPRNPDVRGVPLGEIRDLFPGFKLDRIRVTPAPPLARRLAAISPWLCRRLEGLPFLKTHLAVLLGPK